MTDVALDQQPGAGATDAPAQIPAPGTTGTKFEKPSSDAAPATPDKVEATPAEADDGDLLDLDIDAAEEPAEGEKPAPTEDTEAPSLWPKRPDDLDASDDKALADWKAKAGLPDRAAYDELPELDGGATYTDVGTELGNKVMELGYKLDLPPEVAQQFVKHGDQIIKQVVESRDAVHKQACGKEIVDSFKRDRKAAEAFVIQAKSNLRQAFPGMDEMLLEARVDGRKLVHNPEFLRWASELRASPAAASQPQQDRTQMLRDEAARLSQLMRTDIDTYRGRPWEGTNKTGAERALEIARELGKEGPPRASDVEVAKEIRKLEDLKARDPDLYEHGSWPGARSPAQRHYDLTMRRSA